MRSRFLLSWILSFSFMGTFAHANPILVTGDTAEGIRLETALKPREFQPAILDRTISEKIDPLLSMVEKLATELGVKLPNSLLIARDQRVGIERVKISDNESVLVLNEGLLRMVRTDGELYFAIALGLQRPEVEIETKLPEEDYLIATPLISSLYPNTETIDPALTAIVRAQISEQSAISFANRLSQQPFVPLAAYYAIQTKIPATADASVGPRSTDDAIVSQLLKSCGELDADPISTNIDKLLKQTPLPADIHYRAILDGTLVADRAKNIRRYYTAMFWKRALALGHGVISPKALVASQLQFRQRLNAEFGSARAEIVDRFTGSLSVAQLTALMKIDSDTLTHSNPLYEDVTQPQVSHGEIVQPAMNLLEIKIAMEKERGATSTTPQSVFRTADKRVQDLDFAMVQRRIALATHFYHFTASRMEAVFGRNEPLADNETYLPRYSQGNEIVQSMQRAATLFQKIAAQTEVESTFEEAYALLYEVYALGNNPASELIQTLAETEESQRVLALVIYFKAAVRLLEKCEGDADKIERELNRIRAQWGWRAPLGGGSAVHLALVKSVEEHREEIAPFIRSFFVTTMKYAPSMEAAAAYLDLHPWVEMQQRLIEAPPRATLIDDEFAKLLFEDAEPTKRFLTAITDIWLKDIERLGVSESGQVAIAHWLHFVNGIKARSGKSFAPIADHVAQQIQRALPALNAKAKAHLQLDIGTSTDVAAKSYVAAISPALREFAPHHFPDFSTIQRELISIAARQPAMAPLIHHTSVSKLFPNRKGDEAYVFLTKVSTLLRWRGFPAQSGVEAPEGFTYDEILKWHLDLAKYLETHQPELNGSVTILLFDHNLRVGPCTTAKETCDRFVEEGNQFLLHRFNDLFKQSASNLYVDKVRDAVFQVLVETGQWGHQWLDDAKALWAGSPADPERYAQFILGYAKGRSAYLSEVMKLAAGKASRLNQRDVTYRHLMRVKEMSAERGLSDYLWNEAALPDSISKPLQERAFLEKLTNSTLLKVCAQQRIPNALAVLAERAKSDESLAQWFTTPESLMIAGPEDEWEPRIRRQLEAAVPEIENPRQFLAPPEGTVRPEVTKLAGIMSAQQKHAAYYLVPLIQERILPSLFAKLHPNQKEMEVLQKVVHSKKSKEIDKDSRRGSESYVRARASSNTQYRWDLVRFLINADSTMPAFINEVHRSSIHPIEMEHQRKNFLDASDEDRLEEITEILVQTRPDMTAEVNFSATVMETWLSKLGNDQKKLGDYIGAYFSALKTEERIALSLKILSSGEIPKSTSEASIRFHCLTGDVGKAVCGTLRSFENPLGIDRTTPWRPEEILSRQAMYDRLSGLPRQVVQAGIAERSDALNYGVQVVFRDGGVPEAITLPVIRDTLTESQRAGWTAASKLLPAPCAAEIATFL